MKLSPQHLEPKQPRFFWGGGQRSSYLAGNVVLKFSQNDNFSNWLAEVFQGLPKSQSLRLPRPIKSLFGGWIYQGYTAWEFLDGIHASGRYDEKLAASFEFHKIIKNIDKPDFIDKPTNSWGTANLVAWQKLEFDYSREFINFYEQIFPHL